MRLLLSAMLFTAPPAAPAPGQCEQLWEDTVSAAAPDLEPTDELRKSYLSRERGLLLEKCARATPAVLACPAEATRVCSARFPTPPDGGRALGLATCVWPEVQACAQRDFIRASHATIGALLAELQAGSLAPQKGGLLKLAGDRALLSLKGEALAEKRGNGFWLLLVSRRIGARIDGLLVASPGAEPLPPKGEVTLAALKLQVLQAGPQGAEVSTQK